MTKPEFRCRQMGVQPGHVSNCHKHSIPDNIPQYV